MSGVSEHAAVIASTGYALQGVTGVVGALGSASAQRDRGRFVGEYYDIAARMSEIQAQSELDAGRSNVAAFRRQAKQLAAEQRVGIAAQNVDVLSGSAAQGREDIEFFSDLDEATISDMAWQRAFGVKVQAQDFRFQGLMQRQAANFNASQTILNGVASALGSLTNASLMAIAATRDEKDNKNKELNSLLTGGTQVPNSEILTLQRTPGLTASVATGLQPSRTRLLPFTYGLGQ